MPAGYTDCMDCDAKKTSVLHTIAPVWDENSRVLVLGTMPSPASRAAGFFYMHPQNRFWKVLPALFGEACSLQTTVRTVTGQSGSAGHFCCGIILPCGTCLRAVTLTGRPMQASGMRCRMISGLCFPPPLSVRCSVRERQRLPFGRNIVRRTTAYSAAAFQAQARRMPAGRWKHCGANMPP